MTLKWMQEAANRYDHCIRDTLNWLLKRPPLGNGYLNTKVDPISGTDYGRDSGLRGPDFTYGWIQGRGLEALVSFARHFHNVDSPLSARLTQRAGTLYKLLVELHRRDGHVFFLYNHEMQPIQLGSNGVELQVQKESLYTYSDAFAAKGLVAAASYLDPDQSDRYRAYLMNVISAIENDRFQMDEKRKINVANARTEPDDFGPRMILLGAAGLLHGNNRSTDADFAERFINDVLERYHDTASGLLLNVPGQDACNVGHAIEFCGFAFEHLQHQSNDARISTLVSILIQSLETGLQGPGIALSLSAATGEALSEYYPWWPMPEAIRACALGFQLTGNTHLIKLWRQADGAFFNNYWQVSNHFAYQTRTVNGPVDFVPATPDLDPGYHSALSMLSAIKSIDNLQTMR